MSVITVRAADSAAAMDEVARRLGPDALILSTRSRDGLFEIVAGDGRDMALPARSGLRAAAAAPVPEAPTDAAEPSAPQSVAHGFAAYLARAVRPAGRVEPEPAPRAEPGPAAASDPVEPMPAPASAPPAAPERASADAPAPRPAAPVHVIRPRRPGIGLADLVAAPRVVLVGPLGAGKSGLAIQIARRRAVEAEAQDLEMATPGFAFCGTGAYCDAAWLTQKAWLLGAETVVAFASELPPPEMAAPDFVVVSDRHPDAVSAARQLKAADPATRVVLVLPAGLRADRAMAHATRWRGVADAAVLTLGTGEAVDETDTTTLVEAGLPAIAQSWRGTLLEGLGPLPAQAARITRLHETTGSPPQPQASDNTILTEIAG